MAEYIERESLLKGLDGFEPIVQGRHDGMGLVEHGVWAGMCEIVKDEPAADVAPVVRCKDCKHYVDCKAISKKCCYVHLLTPHPMPEDGFCSYGERKEGEPHA